MFVDCRGAHTCQQYRGSGGSEGTAQHTSFQTATYSLAAVGGIQVRECQTGMGEREREGGRLLTTRLAVHSPSSRAVTTPPARRRHRGTARREPAAAPAPHNARSPSQMHTSMQQRSASLSLHYRRYVSVFIVCVVRVYCYCLYS